MSHTLQNQNKTSFDRRRQTADGFDIVLPELGKRGYGVSGADSKQQHVKRANSKLQTVSDMTDDFQTKFSVRRNQY